MTYCIDTCALIDLGERHYPEHIAVFAPIWQHLYTAVDSGALISVDQVKEELENKAGEWRNAFLARVPHMFRIDTNIEQQYAQVISDIENNPKFAINMQRQRFLAGADPWLIALARITGCNVVSSETKNFTNYGMRYVCPELGVNCINLVEFFQANNI